MITADQAIDTIRQTGGAQPGYGVAPSNDPVLRFRTLAYSASVKLRTGVDRGPEAPAP